MAPLRRILVNVIPTKEMLMKGFNLHETCCSLYGVDVESSLHIFKECNVVRAFAFSCKWGCRIDYWKATTIHQWIEIGLNPTNSFLEERMGEEFFVTFMGCFLLEFWKFRNANLFTGQLDISQ